MLFCAHTEEKITPTKPFFMFLQFQKIFPYNVVGLQRTLPNEEGYFQDRLNYLNQNMSKFGVSTWRFVRSGKEIV